MASAFESDAPVLHFKPIFQVRPGRRQHILWPVWIYRVVAPEVKPRKLNVLQLAVLGMHRAGLIDAEGVGKALDLNKQLAAFIAMELMNEKLLDARGRTTKAGQQALEELACESDALVTGHVFQDPWSGRLWPRFIERLEYAQVEWQAKTGLVHLILGTAGSPVREEAVVHRPDGIQAIVSPEPAEIREACRWHRQAVVGLEPSAFDDSEAYAPSSAIPTALKRIALVDEQPTAGFVVATMYMARDDKCVQPEWYVTDPFGLKENVALRGAIANQLESSLPLRSIVEKLFGETLDAQRAKQVAWNAAVRTQAETVVTRRLSLDAQRLAYHEHLLHMETAHQHVSLLAEECPEDLRRNMLTNARRVLEAMFASLAKRYPLHGTWRPLYVGNSPLTDSQCVRLAYNEAMINVGFEGPLPAALATIKPNHVRAACSGVGNWRLRPMIVATLLSAAKLSAHPFRQVASNSPSFLRELNAVVEATGEATHAGGECPPSEMCVQVAGKVYQAIAWIENLPLDAEN